MSRWAGKIPLVAGSQRAYTTFLNRVRMDAFDSLTARLSKNGTATPSEAAAIAHFINVATGRGGGRASNAMAGLNTAFFAPRLVMSRFQLLLGQPMWRGTASTRLLIAQEYARFLAGAAVVYGLANLAGGKVEDDPRSSDFGKIRVGDTRVDPLGGLSQASVLLSRLATGETKRLSGAEVPIRGEDVPYGGDKADDVISHFLRTKLAPVAGAAVDVMTGETVVGEDVTPQSVATSLSTPLSFGEIFKAMRAQGVPVGAGLGVLSLFGMGMQTFEARKASNRLPRQPAAKRLPSAAPR